MLNLIKTSIFGAFWGLDTHISDAKTDPFIHFGADLLVFLKQIGIQITEKTTSKIVPSPLAFGDFFLFLGYGSSDPNFCILEKK